MKMTILLLNKSMLLLLLISFARPGHAQIAGPTFDSLRTARERSLFVKNEILHLVGMGRVTAVRSRKSCNCGCNIIKESFRQKGRSDYIDVFDFCDSYVFEYTSMEESGADRFDELMQILREHGFKFVDNPILIKDKFRVKHRVVEGSDPLTFMEEKIYKSGKCLIRISLSTPE